MVVINFDEKFRGEVMRAIEDAITNLWGKDVEQVIFFNFSKDTKLSKDEIIDDPDLFEATLEKIFGEQGSASIRFKVIKEINNRFQVSKKEAPQALHLKQAIRLAWKTWNASTNDY
jgi:hypothetical protein